MNKGMEFYKALYKLVLNNYDFSEEKIQDIYDIHKLVCHLIRTRKINNEIIKLYIDDNYKDEYRELENDYLEECFDIYLKELSEKLKSI